MAVALQFLRSLFQNDLAFRLSVFFLTIVISVVIAWVLSLLIRKVIRPFVKRHRGQVTDDLLTLTRKGLFRFFMLGGTWYGLGAFRKSLDDIELASGKLLINQYPYFDNVVFYIEQLLFILFVLVLLTISFRLVTIGIAWYSHKINAEENQDLSGSLFPLLNKVAKILLTGLAVAVVLAKFHIDVSGFIVSLGVGSLAIALAAQETISNMIGGFIIMTDRPFRIGDRIRIGQDVTGDVVAIGIRSTRIVDFDHNILSIPNADIVKSRIINYNYPDASMRVVVDLSIAYEAPLPQVRALLLRCAAEHPALLPDPAPEVFVVGFAESSVNLRLIARTNDYKAVFDIASELRAAVLASFRQEGISFPYPSRVIHIKNQEGQGNA